MSRGAGPKRLLSARDGVFLVVGMVIGAGIFKAPSIVAANAQDPLGFMLLWIAGGAVSLCGALVYAELSGSFPEAGGEYRFLGRAYGQGAAFVFAWSRMTVIQTGAIAAVAFVFGDYAGQLLPLGAQGGAIYAGLGVAALTALNLAGTPQSAAVQKLMGALLLASLAAIAAAGLIGAAPRAEAPAAGGDIGLAMVFVLLTYGGWNEAAYIARGRAPHGRSGATSLRSPGSAHGARRAARRPTRCCCRVPSRSRWSPPARLRRTASPRWWRTPRRCSGASSCFAASRCSSSARAAGGPKASACPCIPRCRLRSASPAPACSIRASTTSASPSRLAARCSPGWP